MSRDCALAVAESRYERWISFYRSSRLSLWFGSCFVSRSDACWSHSRRRLPGMVKAHSLDCPRLSSRGQGCFPSSFWISDAVRNAEIVRATALCTWGLHPIVENRLCHSSKVDRAPIQLFPKSRAPKCGVSLATGGRDHKRVRFGVTRRLHGEVSFFISHVVWRGSYFLWR